VIYHRNHEDGLDNNTLYKQLPVTLVYSKAFASIIQQNPNMVDTVFDFRSFM